MQDEGVENLRSAKEHLSPLVYIRKYTVIYHSLKASGGNDDTDAEQTWTMENLKFRRKKDGEQNYYVASGKILSDNADQFYLRMMEACEQEDRIILDLSEGLRVLLAIFRKKGPEGFVICGVSDYLRETLAMVGFD